MKGVFVTLEGGEGTGKTTQLARLARHLDTLGRTVVLTREPGGTALGRAVRTLVVQETATPPTPVAELLLYEADRAHHVATVLRPALEAGRVVLCDRYADATEVYQGWGRELPLAAVRAANELATGGLVPDRTLVLDLDPIGGVARALGREALPDGDREDRFEREGPAFHERVRAGYRSIAQREPGRVRLVDATGTPDEVFARLWLELCDLFPPAGP